MSIESAIAANRFGLGAKPGQLRAISGDPRGWLLEQLDGPGAFPPPLEDLPHSSAALEDVREAREMRRAGREAAADKEPLPDVFAKYGAVVRRHYLQQAEARLRVAAETDFPFHERLVHFWSNHFAVSADKQPIPAVAGLFENEAIRPNLGGSFADLLLAVESHPAMIIYLDNHRSAGPRSAAARRASKRRGRDVGLNENLAREILELHTVGVDGGYDQSDVTALARVLTGWSVGGGQPGGAAEGDPGMFEFRESLHEPGSQVVLGKKYAAGGMRQGRQVLRDLAAHPSTASFVATKLARHFIADEPPAAAVAAIARVFRDTDGDLMSVHAALVSQEAAWQRPFTKFKTPEEYVLSAFRAFDHEPANGRSIVGALEIMGQAPFRPGSPAGWPDTAEAWGGADALYKRIEWANAAARQVGGRANPLALATDVLGPGLGERTRTALARAESIEQGTTLFLVSPEFQRR